MKIALYLVTVAVLAILPQSLYSQDKKDPFNASRQSIGQGNSSVFNDSRANNFNDYRQTLNAEYVSKTREKWKDFNSCRGLVRPDNEEKPVTPVVMSDEDALRERMDRNLDIHGSVTPIKDNGRVQPLAPIQEVQDANQQYLSFTFLGTSLKVRTPGGGRFSLAGTSENAVADAWNALSNPRYNNLLVDCIKLRSSLDLCDWAYLMMLKAVANSYCGANTNESTLLMAYIFSQSGYRMRLAEGNGKLEMLYASQHSVYDVPYFECDGDRFFAMSKKSGTLRVNAAKFPKERSLSLWVLKDPRVSFAGATIRELKSKRYPDFAVQVHENVNLMSFFDSYPSSEVGGNFMTRWAMYANTPLCQEVQNELYPQLKRYIGGRSELDAVERLLNWVQTAFVYKLDNEVWGGDRAFFPDESLYYPYCDCEDRSILFTRLVRDLLGLKCILIYYPGHLASAVCFRESVKGDYINVNGSRYVVCDPTYIGAPVGSTMPDMDNASAKVILLQ